MDPLPDKFFLILSERSEQQAQRKHDKFVMFIVMFFLAVFCCPEIADLINKLIIFFKNIS